MLNKLLWAILLILVGMIFPVAWIIIIPLLVLLIIAVILDIIITLLGVQDKFFCPRYYVSEIEFLLLIKILATYSIK